MRGLILRMILVPWELYGPFLLASALLVAVPGPNVTLIVANAASGGVKAGLATVAGTETGSALLLTALVMGFGPVVAVAADWFDVLRLVGAAYLFWLGVSRLRLAGRAPQTAVSAQQGRGVHFRQGLLALLANPKVLLFFAAFLPQFVVPEANVTGQLALLSASFLIIAFLIDGAYAVVAGLAGRRVLGAVARKWADRGAGGLLMLAGLWLALQRR